MRWARTVRIRGVPADAEKRRITDVLAGAGASIAFGERNELNLTYALVQGAASSDPAEARAALPDAQWFEAPSIALEITPVPAEALPFLAEAFGGEGAPRGVHACELQPGSIVVVFDPAVTPASLILATADVELRRFSGTRCCRVLAPLPESVVARVAADGLNAQEIATGRILEVLLERARVE